MIRYKKIKLSKGITKDEHRLIIEKLLGRKLLRTEIVHHIDGNIRNNNINNLVVMSLAEHSKLHMTGRVISNITKEKCRIKSTKPNISCRKLTDIDAEYIRGSNKTFNGLAKMFNVSKSTICGIKAFKTYKIYQGVTQSGRDFGLGPKSRESNSPHLDQNISQHSSIG